MVLLTGMIRRAAITGRTDTIGAWCAGRQGGLWAQQMVRAALPTAAPQAPSTPPGGRASARAESAEALRELTELHQQGVVTDDEFEGLRARLNV
jgi:hypothetical protein